VPVNLVPDPGAGEGPWKAWNPDRPRKPGFSISINEVNEELFLRKPKIKLKIFCC
jgi:hypothetical protein